jgi:hypothetical protein
MKPAPLASLIADRMRGSRRAGMDWMAVLGEEGIIDAIVWLSGKGVTARGAGKVLDEMCAPRSPSVEEAYNAVKPPGTGE